MSELRPVQHDVEILRSRIDGVEALRDMRELREGQEALSTRATVLKNVSLRIRSESICAESF